METVTDQRKKKSASRKGLALAAGLSLAALLFGTVAAASGGDAPPDPEPDPKPDDPPKPPGEVKFDPPPPKGEAQLDLPPPAGSLGFDLSTNWGGIPWELRKELARIELASLEPGVGRALAVKAWQAFRALLPYVTPAEAAKIAAANPTLCRGCFNPNDGADSKKLLDANIAQGWPTPVDYAGAAAGSYGLFDILGASAVHAGVHTDPKSWLPLVKLADFAAGMKRYDVQGFAATYIIRRIMYSEKYKVLRPGVQAAPEVQDSFNTWGNIFSAWVGPDDYAKGNQASIDRKTRYLARAKEIGIDLTKVAYPWPPGKSYAAPGWTAGQVWARLQDYAGREVYDTEGGKGDDLPPPAEEEDAPAPPPEPAPEALQKLAGGLQARIIDQGGPNAPLLLVLHGRNADDTQLRKLVPPNLPARVVFLRADGIGAAGYRWFSATSGAPPAELAPQIAAAADKVIKAIAELDLAFSPPRIYAFGYSQGAAVAYELAARDAVAGAVIAAGFFPAPLFPKGSVSTKLWAIHGSKDELVLPGNGQAAYEAFILKADPKGITIVANGTHNVTTLKTAIASDLKAMVLG